MKLQLLLLTLFMVVSSAAAQAQLINIAIDPALTGSGSSDMSGAAVLGGSSDQWNLLDTSSSTGTSLTDSNGGLTAVTLSYSNIPGVNWAPSYPGSYADINSGLAPGLLVNSLYNFASNGAASFTLTGLAPDTQYNLVLYTTNYNSGADATYTVNGLTGTLEQNQSGTFTSTPILVPPLGDAADTVSGNYIQFPVTTDGLGILDITQTAAASNTTNNGNGAFIFTGLQIEAVPEPSVDAMMVAGLGALLFILARKRRTVI